MAGASREEGEARLRDHARQHLRRNYLAQLAHGLLGQTGFRLIHAPTFVPAYIFELSGSNMAVGLARAIQSLGMLLSPVLGASAIEHRRRVLGVGLVVGGAMRVQVLGLALAGLLLPAPWNLRAIFLFLGLFGFFLGMQSVVFNVLVSKVIPLERRGILMGLRSTLSGITAAAVAVAGGAFVERATLGNGYASTFLVAFALTSLGLVALLFVREPEAPRVRMRESVGARLRQMPALLRSDRAFTAYFVARALGTMGRMGFPYYWLFANSRMELTGADLGQLSAAYLLGQNLPTVVWGAVADRMGFRAVFVASLGLWIAATGGLLAAQTPLALLVAFGALGAGQGGFMLSSQNLALEFGSRENLPMRIAVANTATEVVGAIAPLLGGVLAAAISYTIVLEVALGVQALALLFTLSAVSEPRHRRR